MVQDINRDHKGRFQQMYINSKRKSRDRFEVAFNKEERAMFTEMQRWIGQHKDPTAIKQWAFYGWLTIYRPGDSLGFIKEKLFKNKQNNDRHGINVEVELENKFRQLIDSESGKMSL